MQQQATPTGWHVAKWSQLAWLETILKAGALAIGSAALISALGQGVWALPGGLRLAQMIVLGILALGLLAAIADRLRGREIVAMIFVVFNNLGHWGMLIALAARSGPGAALAAFAALMLAGDLVKLVFLKTSGFTVPNTPRAVLYGLTGVYVAGYALILLLEWLR